MCVCNLKAVWGAQEWAEKVLIPSGTRESKKGEVGAACGPPDSDKDTVKKQGGIQWWELAHAFPKFAAAL